MHRRNDQLQKQGITSLQILARDPNNRKCIVDNLGLEAIVRAMNDFTAEPLIQLHGCAAILPLCMEPYSGNRVVTAVTVSGSNALMKILETATHSSERLNTVRLVLDILFQLSKHVAVPVEDSNDDLQSSRRTKETAPILKQLLQDFPKILDVLGRKTVEQDSRCIASGCQMLYSLCVCQDEEARHVLLECDNLMESVNTWLEQYAEITEISQCAIKIKELLGEAAVVKAKGEAEAAAAAAAASAKQGDLEAQLAALLSAADSAQKHYEGQVMALDGKVRSLELESTKLQTRIAEQKAQIDAERVQAAQALEDAKATAAAQSQCCVVS